MTLTLTFQGHPMSQLNFYQMEKKSNSDVNSQIEVSSGALIESNPDLERFYSGLGASTPSKAHLKHRI